MDIETYVNGLRSSLGSRSRSRLLGCSTRERSIGSLSLLECLLE